MSVIDDTIDEISTDIFDSDSLKEESSNLADAKSLLFSSPFSRSFGDLQQIQEDLHKFSSSKKMRKTASFAKYDMNEVLFERSHSSIDKWFKCFPSKDKFKSLKSNSIPLSPTCYRRLRKQNNNGINDIRSSSVPKEISPRVVNIKNLMKKPGIRSHSRKNETSEENSNSCQATLDEYSNSIFIEDDDPTVRDHDPRDCDFSEISTSSDGVNNENFAPTNSNLAVRSKSQETKPCKNTITKECVTFNPLFASSRAQCFIETRKQSWGVPDEELIVSKENPLFKNYFLHQKLIKNRIEWQVPMESQKNKKRFFRCHSLTDILPYRGISKSKLPEMDSRSTPDTSKKNSLQ